MITLLWSMTSMFPPALNISPVRCGKGDDKKAEAVLKRSDVVGKSKHVLEAR